MAQLLISDIDDDVVERLERRAKRHGRNIEAEARAILEEAAQEEPLQPGLGEDGARMQGADERGFGDLMYARFKDIGLKEDEISRFNKGIAGFNSRWEMSLPDFEADEYEKSASK